MDYIKSIIIDLDFFAHSSFHRYRGEEAYGTFVGGIFSILLILLFIIGFFSLALNTLSYSIIVSSVAKNYDADPTYSQVQMNPSQFMFAVGLTGVDLSSSQRYFDIMLNNRTYLKGQGGSGTIKTASSVPLKPCTIDQWNKNS